MSAPEATGWRASFGVLALARHGRRRLLAVFVVGTFGRAVLPALMAVAVGATVALAADLQGGAGPTEPAAVYRALALLAAVTVAERTLPGLADLLRARVARDIDGHLRGHVGELLARDPTLATLERADVQADLGLLRGDLLGTPGAAVAAAVEVAGRYVQTVAALVVVGWFSPLLAVVTFGAVLVIRQRWHRAFGELADVLIDGAFRSVRATYFADLLLAPRAAKEVRVFGLGRWFADRQAREWAAVTGPAFAVRARLRRDGWRELLGLGTIYLVTFVLAAHRAAAGEITLGLLAALVQAELAAAQLIAPGERDFAVSSGLAARGALQRLDARAAGEASVAERPRPHGTITFERVTMRYGDAPVAALDGLDLDLVPGRSTAIVGVNGAGKTTVAKLLCGLYRPSEGRLLVDGEPIDLAAPAWQRRVAAIFQDFVHYDGTIGDNITAGAPGGSHDEALARAVERAGARRFVERLPLGLDTPVVSGHWDGRRLSGGEWQRIALARALYAVERGATVLVLDEPTANLDVRLEAELFERFFELTAGVTALIISHRFSTVRLADRIVVLDRGRLVEAGTHAELLAGEGRYAHLFRLQARRFTDDREAGCA